MKCRAVNSADRQPFLQLLLDEAEWHKVHLSIFGRRPNISGSTIAECQVEFDKLEYQGARRFVLQRLSLRSYHSNELTDALQQRKVSEATISRVITEFTTMGYLNDPEWIKNTVQRLQRQKCGPRAIKMKLVAKGLPAAEIDHAIEGVCNQGAQRENIKRLMETRYRSRNLADPKEKQKVVAGLLRKGFGYEEIKGVLREMR